MAYAVAVLVLVLCFFAAQPLDESCFNNTGVEWARLYGSCCVIEAGRLKFVSGSPMEGWCAICCCVDVDYVFVRGTLSEHAAAVAHAPSTRLASLLNYAYVVSGHLALGGNCLPSVKAWMAAPDPVGVLALRLFRLLLDARNYYDSGMVWREALEDPKAAYAMLQVGFHGFSLQKVVASRWPIFMLLLAISKLPLVEVPDDVQAERMLLQSSGTADGELYRLLWDYVGLAGSELPRTAARIFPELQRLSSLVSPGLVIVMHIAQLEMLRQMGVANEARIVHSLPHDLSFPLRPAGEEVKDVRYFFHHTFPMLTLLDHLALPILGAVEGGVELILPTPRGESLAANKASLVLARGASGCKDELMDLLSARNVSVLVDIGAMFGACSVVAAKRFPEIQVLALEKDAADVVLMQRSARHNRLNNLEAAAVQLLGSFEEAPYESQDDVVVGPLCSLYPFDPWALDVELLNGSHTIRRFARKEVAGVARRPGIFLWLSEMSGQLHDILRGGRELFARRLVDTVAVNTIAHEVSKVRDALGDGYTFEELWHSTGDAKWETVILVASVISPL